MPANWVLDEDKWKKAKEIARKAGRAGDYAYITGVYRQMGGRILRRESSRADRKGLTRSLLWDPCGGRYVVKAAGGRGGTLTDEQRLRLYVLLLSYGGERIPDEAVHYFAEREGISTDDLESCLYGMAARFAQLDAGGKATLAGLTAADVDPEQLRMGVEVELEHTPDRATATQIALDHLAEFPTYYTALAEMERGLGVGIGKARLVVRGAVRS